MSEESEVFTAVTKLVGTLNNFNYKENADEASTALVCMHRTLQQSFWRMIFSMIGRYAETEFHDGRNEYSVKTCMDIALAMEKVRGMEWKVIANCPTI